MLIYLRSKVIKRVEIGKREQLVDSCPLHLLEVSFGRSYSTVRVTGAE